MFGITTALAGAPGSTASSTGVDFELNTTLDLSADRSPSPTSPFMTTLLVKLPSARPEIAALRASEVGSDSYERVLEGLLASTGLFPEEWTRERIAREVTPKNPPGLVIDKGMATLSLTISQLAQPWELHGDPPIVDWVLDIGRATPGTSGTVKLHVVGAEVRSVQPVPTADDGRGQLEWRLVTASPTTIDVRLRVPTIGMAGPGWFILLRQSLVPLLPFVPTLVLLLLIFWATPNPRHDPHLSLTDTVSHGTRSLRSSAWAGLVLIAAVPLAWVALLFPGTMLRSLSLGREYDRLTLASSVAQVVIPVGAAAVFFLVSRRIVSGPARSVWAATGRGLGLAFVVLLAGATAGLLAASNLPEPRPVAWAGEVWYAGALVGAGLVFALVTVLLLLLGTVRFIITPWRNPSDRGLGRRRTVISLLLLAALAIVFHWAVVSWVAFAKVSPPVDSSGGLDRLGALLRSSGRLQVLYLPVSFVLAMLNFLPYVVLAGLITVLQAAGRSDAGLFVLRTRWAWRLLAVSFAGFVIGLGGTVPFLEGRIGLPVAFALGLLGMRYLPRRNVDAAVTKIEMLNQVPSASSALLSARREILERAMTVLLMKRTQRELFSEYMSRKLPGHTYYARHARLEREWRQVAEEGENEEPDKFRLPTGWPPGKMALSLGPADTWWQNGMTAVKVGAKLAVVPIAYYLYVLLTKQLPDFFTTRGGWPYLSAAASLLGEVSFWLVAALVLGCLYPYLPGRNGVLKSLSMTGLYVATLTIGTWLLGGEPGWIFRSLQLLLFLAALGLSLDWMTITRAGLYWEHLIEYYRLRDARVLAGSASSLLLALLAIGQQLLSGDAQQAVTELIRSFTSLIPQVPMGGG